MAFNYGPDCFVYFIYFRFLQLNVVVAAAVSVAAVRLDRLINVSINPKILIRMIDNVNATQGGVSTKNLTSAYDFFIQYAFRFEAGTSFALVSRP